MKKSVKKVTPKRWETHVRLDDKERIALEAVAKREARSVTAQITVYIRQGLEADGE